LISICHIAFSFHGPSTGAVGINLLSASTGTVSEQVKLPYFVLLSVIVIPAAP